MYLYQKAALALFLLLGSTGLMSCGGNSHASSSKHVTPFSNHQNIPLPSANSVMSQIIGTQAIGAAYQFTTEDKVIEQARRIQEMGSTMIKINISSLGRDYKTKLDKLLQMPFDTFFFWWRSDSESWKGGFDDPQKRAIEEEATYEFTKYLLTHPLNVNRQRNFYIGHWEGDWYLLPDYNTAANPTESRIKGMINWLNVRQHAIERARTDVGSGSSSKVFHYAEVNRVKDAMLNGKKRVVNAVLPNTQVDYVSYSAYDVQNDSLADIKQTLSYIKSHLPEKSGASDNRIFIGECGVPAIDVGFNKDRHEQVNRDIFVKFMKSGVPYILYWEMYNNEIDITTGQQRGYWLIDDRNQTQPLYHTLAELYATQKSFTDIPRQSIDWLEQRRQPSL